MKQRNDLYNYQELAVKHILSLNGSMIWLDVGMGKTIVSLTAVEYLLDSYRATAALVIAPVKVIEAVWEQEAEEWRHTSRLKFSLVRGTPRQRVKKLQERADIYLINYEQLQWLKEHLEKEYSGRKLPFDIVVFDEISKMKHSTAKRCRAFAKLLPHFKYRIGLTGTPATNGLADLHGQFLMVDGGLRLGPNVTTFRDRWFLQNPWTYKWEPRRGVSAEIRDKISDITLEMNADDYLEMPPLQLVDKVLELPPKILKLYKEFEEEFFIEIGDSEVEAFNAAAKSAKCRQLANGAVYSTDLDMSATGSRDWEPFHSIKLDALEEIVEELNGAPLLVCYQFIHDKARIKERFPDAVFVDSSNVAPTVESWNRGEIKMLVGHPQSMGHGLNLQYGGNHICWFGLPWDLEHYIQATGRLLRNGQEGAKVFSHRLIAKDTVEGAIAQALQRKDADQRDLRYMVKAYRERSTPLP